MKWYVSSYDDLHCDIELPPNEVIALGRSEDSGISDKSVSKLHTLLKYQPAKEIVLCKQLGKHPALINGEEIKKDMKVRIGLKSVIELLPGKYRYTIAANKGKRRLSDTTTTSPVKRHQNNTLSPSSKQTTLQTRLVSSSKPGLASRDTTASRDSSATASSASVMSRVSAELSSFLLSKLDCGSADDTGGSSPWIVAKDLIVRNPSNIVARSKVAAFDFDHTIVTTKSGNVFPKNPDDWDIMWPGKIPAKLKQLHEDGYKLLIISNQNGIEAKKVTVQQFQDKMDKAVSKLGVPIQVFAAPRSTATRKPAPGMWVAFEEIYNGGVPVDYNNSFYVGDAAGRTAGWDPNNKKRKDFSSSDREFAHNVGLNFHTPEAFFLGHQESTQWKWKSFDVSEYNSIADKIPLIEGQKKLTSPFQGQEMIMMVGYPGSGKSSFCKRHLDSYIRVNMDELKSYKKCVALVEESLSAGKSVVIDNTCPDSNTRKRYVELAEKNKVPVRCFVMGTTLEHAKHNNRYRRIAGSGEQVPGIAFNTFKSRYQTPDLSEGFSDILNVNFKTNFTDKRFQELYCMFQGG